MKPPEPERRAGRRRTGPRESQPARAAEARLLELKQQAAIAGTVGLAGIRPPGAPFPMATPQTGYYGIPLLKEPQWKWEVPVYFFVGGAAGAAAVVGEIAGWTGGDPELRRHARWIAAVGSAVSPVLLTADLGVPSRFLNMLRVFKLQSPMSIGAWTLVAFSNSALAAAFAGEVARRLDSLPVRLLENAAGALAAATGTVMASYTGVLIGATAIPVWSENVSTLPLHFAASGMGSAVSLLELIGHDQSRALNILGIASAALETVEGMQLEWNNLPVNDPLKHGASGAITRAGSVLSGPLPLALRLAASASGNRKLRRAAAWSSLVGSMLTRVGWLRAGHASARDHRLPLQLQETEQAPPLPQPGLIK